MIILSIFSTNPGSSIPDIPNSWFWKFQNFGLSNTRKVLISIRFGYLWVRFSIWSVYHYTFIMPLWNLFQVIIFLSRMYSKNISCVLIKGLHTIIWNGYIFIVQEFHQIINLAGHVIYSNRINLLGMCSTLDIKSLHVEATIHSSDIIII